MEEKYQDLYREDWSKFIFDILRKNGEEWRKQWLKEHSTLKDRIAEINRLKAKYTKEWLEEINRPSNWESLLPNKDQKKLQMEELLKILKHKIEAPKVGDQQFNYWYVDKDGVVKFNRSDYNLYKSHLYLKGNDFKTTRYANTTSEKLLQEYKDAFIYKAFTNNKNPLKVLDDTFGKFLKSTVAAERDKFKKDISSAVERVKRRALGAGLSLLDQLDPRKAINNAKSVISEEASKTMKELRDHYIGGIEGVANDMIDELQDIGSKFIGGAKAKVKDWAINTGTSVYNSIKSHVGPMLSKFGSFIPEPVARLLAPAARILGSGVERIANRLGLGSIFGFKRGAGGDNGISADYTFTGAYNAQVRSTSTINPIIDQTDYLHKNMIQELADKWTTMDLMQSGDNLRDVMNMILEDAGQVTSELKSIAYSRAFHFTQRPVLGSESAGLYRTFAYFTRPNLNLIDGGQPAPSLTNYPDLKAMVLRDPGLYSELCRDGAFKSNLFKLLNNYVKEVAAPRLSETGREGIANMHGKSSIVPGVPEIHGDFDIQVTFIDNNRFDIANLLYMLSIYKEYVSKQGYPMRDDYIRLNMVDYLMTLYLVMVDVNWDYINLAVAYELVIAEPPTHFARMQLGGLTKSEIGDDITVTFKCPTFIPQAPHMIDTFNLLSGFHRYNLVDTRGFNGFTLMATGRESMPWTSESHQDRHPILDPRYPQLSEYNEDGDPESCAYLFPGVFELLAVSPGFYRVPTRRDRKEDIVDPRLNIKFGFSS